MTSRILAAIIWALLVVATGLGVYFHQRESLRRERLTDLAYIADLQAHSTARWIADQERDAAALGERQLLAGAVDQLGKSEAMGLDAVVVQLQSSLVSHRESYRLRAIAVVDLDGTPLLETGHVAHGDPLFVSTIAQAIGNDAPVMADLHWAGTGATRHVELGFAAPLRLFESGNARTVGAVYTAVDPGTEIYPALRNLPPQSSTTEVLLARREGADVVFLSPLRHHAGSPLTLRRPITANMVAARALQGFVGEGAGLDYAFVPVLAAARPITGTSWVLIARTAIGEVDRRARNAALWAAAVIGILLLCVSFLLWLILHRRAEAFLRKSEARFRSLVTATAQIVWVTRPDGGVEVAPAAWRDFTGQSPDEIRGWGWLAALHPDDQEPTVTIWKAALASRTPVALEYRIRGRDGSYRHFDVRGVPVLDNAGDVLEWIGTCTDITARKDAEGALHAANAELESFSYSVSHDLRVPLRAVDGFSHLLEKRYGAGLDQEGMRLLRVIRENTAKMGALIEDILAYSRMGRVELTRSTVDMAALARAAAAELTDAHSDRQIDVRIADLPPATGDAAMLRQVWINLIDNAMKYTRPRPLAHVRIGGQRDGGENVYFINDDGVGFDMRYVHKLFGVFQRLHGVTEFEGTGIGLAIVKRIVARHGGRVWAESKVNEGATFHFTLPRFAGVADSAKVSRAVQEVEL